MLRQRPEEDVPPHLVDDLESIQRRLPQPSAQLQSTMQLPSTDQLIEMMLEMQRQQARRDELMHQRQQHLHQQLISQMAELKQGAQQNTAQPTRTPIGQDVEPTSQHHTDTFQNKDSPMWHLAPGLILPRYLADRFKIFSIPHLLFKENGAGEMVKVPKGTALPAFKELLTTYKTNFAEAMSTTRASDPRQTAMNAEGVQGLIEQRAMNERVVAGLVAKLDALDADQLPSTREEWQLFLDVGTQLQVAFATQARGFIKGGAKVATAYNLALQTSARFDPSAFWPTEEQRQKAELCQVLKKNKPGKLQ